MKLFVLCFIILNNIFLAFTESQSQVAPSKFWIRFTDKNNSPYSLTNPSAYLSQRAITRRQNQNIPITASDIPVNASYVDSVKNKSVKILNISRWFNSVTIDTSGCDDTLIIDKITALPFVKKIQPVGKKKPKPSYTPLKKEKNFAGETPGNSPEDQQSPSGYIFKNTSAGNSPDYGESFTQINMLKGDALHSRGFKGNGKIIGVLDAGFYKADQIDAFDSLRSANGIISTRDFVYQEDSVYNNPYSHGTYVLSALAGNIPGHLIGSAPGASYILLCSEAPGENPIEELNWASAAEYADSAGADILSTSLGYTVFDDAAYDHTYQDMDGNTAPITIASDIAASKGMLVVNAAGNEGNSPWHYIGAPADGDSVLAIGAVDEMAQRVSFSSTGPTYDKRIKPNVAALGKSTVVASLYGGITTVSGTSLATPIISGLAACLWQANPTASARMVFDAIQKSASQYNTPDSLLGYGIPDFFVADLLLKGVDPDTALEDKLINIYPNPFYNTIVAVFYSVNTQTILFELHDIGGMEIFYAEETVSAKSYNTIFAGGLQNLSSGIYFFRMTYSSGNKIVKLIKQ